MLLTLPEFKDLANVSTTALDTQYNALLVAADSVIKTELDRDIEQFTYTEYYSGNGRRELVLRQYPVTSVTSVNENFSGYFGQNSSASPFDSGNLLVSGKDYVLDFDKRGTASHSGILHRIGRTWQEIYYGGLYVGTVTHEVTPSLGNIKVVYVAGYANVPEDLKYAVALLVKRMQLSLKYGQLLESEKLGDYQYKLAPLFKQIMIEPGTLNSVLRKYRRSPW